MMPRMYVRLARNRKNASVNMRNRLHIQLENWMTPVQFERMCKNFNSLPEDVKEPADPWLGKLYGMTSMARKRYAEPFRRFRLHKHIVVYSNKAVPAAQKTLLVCITGAARRPMMPLMVFLQHIDAAVADVAVVQYPKGEGFRNGLEGLGTGFEGMIDSLGKVLPLGEYARVAAFGTSGGALPALAVAAYHGFDAVLAVGIGPPDDGRWAEHLEGGPRVTMKRYMARTSHPPRVWLLHGADELNDGAAANDWGRVVGGTVIRASDHKVPVGHVALFPIVMRGQFAGLLNDTVFNSAKGTAVPATLRGALAGEKE